MLDNDHRKLGASLDLYHIEEDSPGFIYWHPKGWALYRLLEDFIRDNMKRYGYQEVRSPMVLPQSHWERSGHWEKFGDNMYAFQDDDKSYALKPMSCPGHVAIYNSQPRSWRDLPFRLCEFGICHRNESSGGLMGLLRSRSFEQDDAHVLCHPDQVKGEISRFIELLQLVYHKLGFENIQVDLSLRPDVRAGSDEDWDWAEESLMIAARENGLEPNLLPGEGAFYGPKLEFALHDNQGRKWQCGTVQLDRVLPARLGASYHGEDGDHHVPIMIHHAVLGSLGRFIAIMLEHYEGKLPLWLAPVQLAILPVSEHQQAHARHVADQARKAGIRVEVFDQNETLNRRLVMARSQKIPIEWVIGKREANHDTVTHQHNGEKSVMPREQAQKWIEGA